MIKLLKTATAPAAALFMAIAFGASTSRRLRFSPSLNRRVGRPATSMRWNSRMRGERCSFPAYLRNQESGLDHLATIVRGRYIAARSKPTMRRPACDFAGSANFPGDHEMLKHGMVSSVPRETLTPTQSRMTSMRRLLVTTTVSVLLGCSTAWAQVTVGTGAPVPLGLTSPLGMGTGASVGVTGIPLGATEMATPGVSPTAAGTSPLGSMTAGAWPIIGGSEQPEIPSP